MRRLNKRLLLGISVTILVVLLCLFIPGQLLRLESGQVIGKPQQAVQQYAADDVSAGDVFRFDMDMRLMMFSDQWKCDRQVVEDHDALGESIWTYSEAFLYLESLVGVYLGLWQDVEADFIGYLTDEKDKEAIEHFYYRDTATDLESVMVSQDKLVLYRYQDAVLNNYFIYVWEYRWVNEELGFDIAIWMDAVTLDIYNISMEGETLGKLPWYERMYYMTLQWDNFKVNEEISRVSGLWMDNIHSAVFLPVAIELSAHETLLKESDYGRVERLRQDEEGYSYVEGNYLIRQARMGTIENTFSIAFYDAQQDYRYACMDVSKGGLHWYLSVELLEQNHWK